jgi:hypothetical protein
MCSSEKKESEWPQQVTAGKAALLNNERRHAPINPDAPTVPQPEDKVDEKDPYAIYSRL